MVRRVLTSVALPLLAMVVGCSGDDGSASTGTGSSTSGDASSGSTTTTGAGTTSGATTSGGASESSTSGSSGPATTGTSGEVTTTSTSGEVTTSTSGGTTGSTTLPVCVDGEVICEGGGAKVCSGGVFGDPMPCAEVCEEGLGCVLCSPGEQACDGDQAVKCAVDGQAWEVKETCDGVQGIFCNADFGACDGVCAPANLQLDYLGCDYYPTVTLQLDGWNGGTKLFAVTVANTADVATKVTVTRGAKTISEVTVGPSSVQMIPLPWVPALTKGTGPSALVEDGAYRLRADNPVTVYQFNPLAADFTNDASLLLPVNAWTGSAMVASWPFWQSQQDPSVKLPGFYAVVASEDDTVVDLAPSATGKKVKAGGGVAADGAGKVTLQRGDVLEVIGDEGGDLTGTRISASRPIQVIAGHKCTNVPADVDACDHLEEAMFPLVSLGKAYLVAPPVQAPDDKKEKAQVVRVIASEPNTTLVFTPDQPGKKTLAAAGDFVELAPSTAAYRVAADKPVLVAQYMVGQAGGYGNSDPAMLLAVAIEQYRADYLFHAPPSWSANYVDVIAPDGAKVTVDGGAVSGFKAITGTGNGVAHVKLSNQGDGNHTVSADKKVGIAVYGVQSFGSYWTAGGLDLEHF
ncbi:MAG TPA: IgGFc-binding protein [Nannocystaceae bacterium]|nr:IgGFc-binding protein [Nannocystaceae bacterium]